MTKYALKTHVNFEKFSVPGGEKPAQNVVMLAAGAAATALEYASKALDKPISFTVDYNPGENDFEVTFNLEADDQYETALDAVKGAVETFCDPKNKDALFHLVSVEKQ